MKPNATEFEIAIVQVRCIGQMLTMMGESLHSSSDPTGEAFVRLGHDLLSASKKLNEVLDDLLISQKPAKADAA
jgi:hypothetical protein